MVSIGMLKQSQKRMNLVALSEESTSRQPARTLGWLAMMPMVLSVEPAKAHDDVLGVVGVGSKKSPLSTMDRITSLHVVGCRGTVRNDGVEFGSQAIADCHRYPPRGGFSVLLLGRKDSNLRICSMQSRSSSAAN